jgi:DNA-binding GntR family transcriptional regulator
MPQEPEECAARRAQSHAAGPAVEDHGRVVTANAAAAAFYRRAQQATETSEAVTALRHAVSADPAFRLATADLEAFTEAAPRDMTGRQLNWERHHIEIVSTAAAGNPDLAVDLLREHLASVGCDPLALRIIAELQRRKGHHDELDDLDDRLPGCHPGSRKAVPSQRESRR